MTKHYKTLIPGIILIISGFYIHGQAQTELALKYDEYVYSTQDMVATTGENRNKGDIKIGFKYYITKEGIEELGMKLEPHFKEDKGHITMLEKGGNSENVLDYFYQNKGKKLTYSTPLQGTNLKKFYNSINNENYLVLKHNYKTGVAFIWQNKDEDIFTINIDQINKNRSIDLTLHFYYGTKIDLDVELKEVKIKLKVPDINDLCDKYGSRPTDLQQKIVSADEIEGQYNEIATKSKIEIQNFIEDIKLSETRLEEYNNLKNSIDKDPLKSICPDLVSLCGKMEVFLMNNDKKRYEALINKLNNRVAEIDAEKAKAEKTVVKNEPEPVKEVTKPKEPVIITQPKKEKSEISCDDYFKKVNEEMKVLERKFSNEAIITKISETNKEIESIKPKAAQASVNESIKKELSDGTKDISNKYNNITTILRGYDNSLNSILHELKERPDCKDKNLTQKVNDFKKTINDYQDQCILINHDLDELSNLTSVGNKMLKDNLRSIYRPIFKRYLLDFTNLDTEVLTFKNTFKSEKNSGKYYQKVKESMLGQVDQLKSRMDKISASYDSLLSAADEEFMAKLNHQAIWSDSTNENISKIALTQNDILNNIKKLQGDVSDSIPDKFPWLFIILGITGALIILFGLRVYYNAFKKRKSKQTVNIGRYTHPATPKSAASHDQKGDSGEHNVLETKPESQKVGGITITRVTSENKGKATTEVGKGLDHVFDHIGTDYKEIDLKDYWHDTLVSKVFIHRSAIKKTYKFFLESCENPDKVLETGGYLIGGWDIDKEDSNKYNVSFEDFIEPGDDAIYGEYQLNFGAKIGVRLEKVIQNYREKMGKEFTLTAWFHSHPAIKIFLSNHDLDVQERLSSMEHKYKLLALVIDPITQEDNASFLTGIFSYKSNGTMNNNAGNLKLINWKKLYEWSISAIPPSTKDYYNIELGTVCDKSAISNIYLSDRCITRFSLFLDELREKPAAEGIFSGEIINGDKFGNELVFFKDFMEAGLNKGSGEQKIVGRFYFTKDPEEKIELLQNQADKSDHSAVLILCDNISKELYVITRKNESTYNSIQDIKKAILFSEIELWPTRRR